MRQDEEVTKCAGSMADAGWVSMMLICIQGKTQDGVYGDICSYHLSEAVPFAGVGDMVLKMDEICNWLGTPQRTTDPRFMNPDMEQRYYENSRKHPETVESLLLERSKLALFPQALTARDVLVAVVKYRQNSSLQGTIRGKLSDGRDISFRSALELMRMMQMI